MKTELFTTVDLWALHALPGNESPHYHLFRLDWVIRGTPSQGKILDLVSWERALNELVMPFQKTYLNQNPRLPSDVQSAATCESLAQFFFKQAEALLSPIKGKNQSIELREVKVSLFTEDKRLLGAARVFLD